MLKICIIYGGNSVEHEISIISANSILNNLNRNNYKISGIFISKKGEFKEAKIVCSKKGIKFSPTRKDVIFSIGKKNPILVKELANKERKINVDVFIPMVHGTGGEDGSIQGLIKLLDKPYVGSNVTSSAVCIDKIITKRIFQNLGIRTTNFIEINKYDWKTSKSKLNNLVYSKIKIPCFVKAANLGSSIGVYKTKTKKDLSKNINKAFKFAEKIIVEEAVMNPNEIEVSILGNNKLKVSRPGLVVPSSEFYDYNAKYIDGKSTIEIPWEKIRKNPSIEKEIKKNAMLAYKSIGCSGMARIDFLYGETKNTKSKKLYASEINTIPGFTSISMYPKLMKNVGISYEKLLNELILFAIEKFKEEKKLSTKFI
tara:strand:+ start:186 stop:1295 length:1110 start_codon:yes stop_codon:yes gene_type:complete